MVEFNRGSWMAVKQKHLVKKYVYVSSAIIDTIQIRQDGSIRSVCSNLWVIMQL